jgi:hypothetical protein
VTEHGLDPAFAAEDLHALLDVEFVSEHLGEHEFAFAGEQ